jgi:PTH2 family peptidyl-tRNA hydrolase
MSEPKQVLIVRKDLNMRKGKIAAQVAHASMKVLLDLMEEYTNDDHVSNELCLPLHYNIPLNKWIKGRFTKVCVSVDSEEELLDLYKKAQDAGILCSLITDSGLTEFHGVPTNTVVAIGPEFPEKLDLITGHLKLL